MAWVDAFKGFGRDLEFDAVRGQIGKGWRATYAGVSEQDEVQEIGEELEKRRGDILKEHYVFKIRAFADVRALFERIKADGRRILLASPAKADELEHYKI